RRSVNHLRTIKFVLGISVLQVGEDVNTSVALRLRQIQRSRWQLFLRSSPVQELFKILQDVDIRLISPFID
ncbi:hypothetical protein, partial [Pleurocapsa sp. CCALA 161]|uniref:hypothetical protein n=1 Tax=Pleurocapsa sp. CCALA 161 TaxID=2107688 RepID=UPI0013047CF7